jgi:hypothetical protein
MSLAIEVDNVTGVLLNDGWHSVIDGSFDMDSYEFLSGEFVLVGGGQVEGVSAMGATWKEKGKNWVACPLLSILAIRYKVAA